jgi:hypothetical protein
LDERRSLGIIRKLVVALLFALLFTFLGFFSGPGYHVNQMEEVSFDRDFGLGFANATFACDVVFNPLVYPFYWFAGGGHIVGNFSMMYVPEGYSQGGRAFYGDYASDRYPEYLTYLTTWGTLPNLVVLLFITLAVEVVGRRILYLLILSGILGFYAFVLIGTIVGVLVGYLAVLLASKLARERGYTLEQVWSFFMR